MSFMLRLLLFIILITSSISFSFCQDNEPMDSEHIRLVARVIGYEYYIGEEKISAYKVDSLLRSNTEAHELFTKAQSNAVFSPIMFIGGGVSGGLFVRGIKKEKVINIQTLVASIGLLTGSIITGTRGRERRKKAIDIYNDGL